MSLSSWENESSNSYRLLSSSSTISITTVTSQFENEVKSRIFIYKYLLFQRQSDDNQLEVNGINWRIEKNVNLKKR